MSGLDDRELPAEYERLCRQGVTGIDADQLALSIMHGNGNVIIVVDEALSGLTSQQVDSDLARALCHAFHSVRVDGIAFVRTAVDPIRMTYFERDGTHSQMCGNALRCVTRYGTERRYLRADSDVVATDDGLKWVSAADGTIRVALGAAREFQQLGPDRWFVFSSLPHLVLLLDDHDDLDAVDVPTRGAELRYDEALCRQLGHPEGLHVNFVQRLGDGIRVRTYEVGVEDETLACGTGVAGSAYVAHHAWGLPWPVRVTVRGGEMRVDDAERELMISGATGHLFSTASVLMDA
jgi:diaminopimelate epimerase